MKHFIPLHHESTASSYPNNQRSWNGRGGNRGGPGNRRGRRNQNNRGNNRNYNRNYRVENEYEAIDQREHCVENASPYKWLSSRSFYESPNRQYHNSGHDGSGESTMYRNGMKRQDDYQNEKQSFSAGAFYPRRPVNQSNSPIRDESLKKRDYYSPYKPMLSNHRSSNWPSSPGKRQWLPDEEGEPFRGQNFDNKRQRQFTPKREFDDRARFQSSTPLSRGQSLVNLSQRKNENGGRQTPTPHDNYIMDHRQTYGDQERRKGDRRHDRNYDSEGRSTSGSEKSGYSPNERCDEQPTSRFGNVRSSNLQLAENRPSTYNDSLSSSKQWPDASPSSAVSWKTSGRTISSLKGFKNLGNTCYINSILQGLFGIPVLVKALLDFDKQCSEHLEEGVLSAVLLLLKERHENPKRADGFEPLLRRVKEAVFKKTKSFEGSGMQDAHEFLIKLLDCLRDDADQKSESNLVDQNFKYEVKEMYTCKQCGNVVYNKQPNNIMSLYLRRVRNLASVQSLQDVIEYNYQKEVVQYDCPKCKHNTSVRSAVFEQLPRVLVLHLKRYRQQSKVMMKNDMALHIPQYVTLLHQADKAACTPNSPVCEKETPPICASHTPQRAGQISKRLCFSASDKENQGPEEETEGVFPLTRPLGDGKCDVKASILPVITIGSPVGLKGGQPQLCATKHSDVVDTTDKIPMDLDETSRNHSSSEEKFAVAPQTQEEEEEWLKKALEQSLEDASVEPRMNGGKPMGSSDTMTVTDTEEDIEDIDLDQTEECKKQLRRNCKSGELKHSYQLGAIISHNGSMQGGHFFTYVPQEQDRWWHFSDEIIKEVTENTVSERTERNGYIVIYTYKST